MLQNYFTIRQFRLTKWSFLVHGAMRNAPYIYTSHDSILKLWRTFPNEMSYEDSIWWGSECLFIWSWLYDPDDHHAHM